MTQRRYLSFISPSRGARTCVVEERRRSSLAKPAGVSRLSMKMFQPKTMQESIMPLLVANILVGTGIWTSKRGRLLNVAYSLICMVTYCFLMKLSRDYLDDYWTHKANSLGNFTFQAIFYANVCLILCLIPCAWLKKKVTWESPLWRMTLACARISGF